jgi:DUF971 family protein
MSHEGIRIVSEATARREQAGERRLSLEAVTPAKVRVKKTEGTGVEIDWRDGHQSAWNFAWLRNACPCATCHEEREKDGREPGVAKPKPGGLLVMYQAPPRPNGVSKVGNYALRFQWNDGHESGIYSWDFLRRMCLCDECLAGREG